MLFTSSCSIPLEKYNIQHRKKEKDKEREREQTGCIGISIQEQKLRRKKFVMVLGCCF
jgi:hypothetical protein